MSYKRETLKTELPCGDTLEAVPLIRRNNSYLWSFYIILDGDTDTRVSFELTSESENIKAIKRFLDELEVASSKERESK